MKLHYALALIVATALPLAVSAADKKGPTSKTDLSETVLPVTEAGSTSLACYFQKGGDVKWYWGLTSDSQWYALPGDWQKTPHTKLQKFFTTANQGAVTTACANASTYYGLVGYTLQSAFAADKGAGYNYPIIFGGNTELWPQY
ncbi:MAG TPA: hypothetical protein VM555_11720 [Tahibacter sp.]|nr:hypothetical protein [Tahibacter sp.]